MLAFMLNVYITIVIITNLKMQYKVTIHAHHGFKREMYMSENGMTV